MIGDAGSVAIVENDPAGAPDDPWDWPVMRENNLYALDRLDEVTSLPGPKYVFAHLVTTHPPYVHNADGSYTGRAQVARLGEVGDHDVSPSDIAAGSLIGGSWAVVGGAALGYRVTNSMTILAHQQVFAYTRGYVSEREHTFRLGLSIAP
mgnify:CR=1 FL=1